MTALILDRAWVLRAGEGRGNVPQHVAAALRVNVFAVVPLTLLLIILSGSQSWRSCVRILLAVAILTNVNFLVLSGLSHLFWRALRCQGLGVYLLLGLMILPVLGTMEALGVGRAFGFANGDVASVGPALMGVSVLLTVLYGMGACRIERFRQSQRRALAQLEKQEELERARRQAEVVALQARIKPHFVFNTLNAIVTLIQEDPGQAEETTLRLARLMRYIMEVGDGTMVSLEREVNVVRAYLEIEKVRMGSHLEYQVEVPDELLPVAVPGMLLQPLVENAIQHGARQRGEGSRIRLRSWAEGDRCWIEITDNGPGFSMHRGTGQSLRLLRDRLDRLYDRRYEFSLERDQQAGKTTASLCLPVTSAGENRA